MFSVRSAILIATVFSAAVFATPNAQRNDCTQANAATLKKDGADCRAQYAAALKDAGLDKEERKTLAAELAECLKKARAKARTPHSGCAGLD